MHAAILLDEDRYARLEQLLDGGALPSRPPLGSRLMRRCPTIGPAAL